MYAQLFIYSQTLTTFAMIIPVGSDFDLVRVTTLFRTLFLERTHVHTIVVEVFTDHVPTVAIAHEASNRCWGDTTNHQWNTSCLRRARSHHEAVPIDKLTVII